MLLEIIYGLVGGWGRAVLEWISANPAPAGIFLLVWIALVLSGKRQLGVIEARTGPLVVEGARKALEENPNLTPGQLYTQIYPHWCQMARRSALFIPHRWELWPLPASPSIIRDRIGFTPQWLAHHLAIHGILVDDASSQEEEHSHKSVPPRDSKKPVGKG